MEVKLHSKKILSNIPTENDLSEVSKLESFYVIRKLKALVESHEYGCIIVNEETNDMGQVYSEKYGIWFQIDEFKYF